MSASALPASDDFDLSDVDSNQKSADINNDISVSNIKSKFHTSSLHSKLDESISSNDLTAENFIKQSSIAIDLSALAEDAELLPPSDESEE